MGQKQEDARHDVEQEIAADRIAAQPQDREHHIEHSDQDHGLDDAKPQTDQRVAMGLAHTADRGVIDQLEDRQRRLQRRSLHLWLKHGLL